LNNRKLNKFNKYFDFDGAEFSIENIAGNDVAVITLNLIDGGLGDYDGIENGVIYDPGGPAIFIDANIPIWDDFTRTIVVLSIFLFGFIFLRKHLNS